MFSFLKTVKGIQLCILFLLTYIISFILFYLNLTQSSKDNLTSKPTLLKVEGMNITLIKKENKEEKTDLIDKEFLNKFKININQTNKIENIIKEEKKEELILDLNKNNITKEEPKKEEIILDYVPKKVEFKKEKKVENTKIETFEKGVYIQVLVTKNQDTINKTETKLKYSGFNVKSEQLNKNGEILTKIYVGPYSDKQACYEDMFKINEMFSIKTITINKN